MMMFNIVVVKTEELMHGMIEPDVAHHQAKLHAFGSDI